MASAKDIGLQISGDLDSGGDSTHSATTIYRIFVLGVQASTDSS
jgi:hypothetical protein